MIFLLVNFKFISYPFVMILILVNISLTLIIITYYPVSLGF